MPHQEFSVCSLNGELIPIEDAHVSVRSIEWNYGFGVYETIRIFGKKALFSDAHIERLFHSATVIGLAHKWETDSIQHAIEELLGQYTEPTYNLKMLLIGAQQPQHAQLFILPLMPHFPDKKLYKTGVDVVTVRYERPFPTAKTLSMLLSYLARRAAKEQGCYEALSVHRDDTITEGTGSNFFVVQNGAIITPPAEKILPGITREKVLQIAAEEKIEIREQDIPLSSIPDFEGALLTSSSGKVMPIRRIDETQLPGIPEVTRVLMRKYDELLASQ